MSKVFKAVSRSISISEDLVDRINQQAMSENRSFSAMVCHMIREYLRNR